MGILIERTAISSSSEETSHQVDENPAPGYVSRQSSTEVDPAPVVMIRNAANNILSKPAQLTEYDAQTHIMQFMQSSEADRLLLMYVQHTLPSHRLIVQIL